MSLQYPVAHVEPSSGLQAHAPHAPELQHLSIAPQLASPLHVGNAVEATVGTSVDMDCVAVDSMTGTDVDSAAKVETS